ncbi:hypothetical protein GXM_07438 [Nostoc sphaeroides CCNUC1]|uniref:Uncharacterized protein n=1 Tax=Nostoc sphaeroides CCNUC1 TaxID=2653204 RepID=A0A5P8WBF2_9NOSO|nr:hypothetical protein GXM_07438 [Nostoc sphaeroides CCNUC1]
MWFPPGRYRSLPDVDSHLAPRKIDVILLLSKKTKPLI